jgi:hypothetical protein
MKGTRSARSLALGSLLLLLPLALPGVAGGQPVAGAAEPGSELTVYLMTMGPGDLVWERFGHNAIWIRDHSRGTDVAYNYGMFSFDQENFLLRFVRGHMDYWMEGMDTNWMGAAYIQSDRSVWAQELNLTPAQRAELRDFLQWNALPENRYYRYDYYRDNCSTRVRDALDLVLGGRIRAQTDGLGSGTTFRSHTRRLTSNDPIVYTGLLAGLGQPVDREISVWEEMFLPLSMRETLRDLTVLDAEGREVPLVLDEVTIYEATRPAEASAPPGWFAAYLALGMLGGGLLLATAVLGTRRRSGRIAFAVLGGGWALVAGILGVVLAILWLFTDHATSYRNENLFHFSPLILPLAGLLPAMVAGSVRARGPAYWLAIVVAASSLLGLLLGLLPPFYQVNGALIALALPINLALAIGIHLHARAGIEATAMAPPAGGEKRERSPAGVR